MAAEAKQQSASGNRENPIIISNEATEDKINGNRAGIRSQLYATWLEMEQELKQERIAFIKEYLSYTAVDQDFTAAVDRLHQVWSNKNRRIIEQKLGKMTTDLATWITENNYSANIELRFGNPHNED